MAKLIVRPKDYEESVIKLDKLRMAIGRSSRNEVCISDPFASRLHAEIRQEGDRVMFVDMGSANGSYLNGQRVNGSVVLQPLDRIKIGETEIEYITEDSPVQSNVTVYLSGAGGALPADTITTSIGKRTTSDLISSIQSASQVAQGLGRSGTGARAVLAADAARRGDLLGIVSSVGIALMPNTSLEETFKKTIEMVFEAIPAERGFLFLKEGDDLVCKFAQGPNKSAMPANLQVQISRSITNKVLTEGASVLTSDAAHDPRFQSQKSVVLSAIRSVMAVPLFSGEENIGLIYVDNPLDNRFAEEDLQVLTTIASVASIKVEHQRLLEERLEKRRMEEELKVASEIQMRLQPVAPPNIPGWDMTGVSFPCREIGGDYYDFIKRKKDNQLILALGDVSGKGTGAALLMSSLHAAVRAQAQTSATIGEVMGAINEYIYENTPSNKFVTLFYALLDPLTGTLTYVNGGHNPPLLIRTTGETIRLDVGGLPIGIMPGTSYREAAVSFGHGDALIVYSDGISESVDDQGEEFGEERLLEVARQNLNRSASGIRDRIEESLSRFVGTAAPVDDMTLVILKSQEALA